MEEKVSKKVKQLLEKKKISSKDEMELERYKEASKTFEQLIQQGVIHKRGYTLMQMEDMYKQVFYSNSFYNQNIAWNKKQN